MTRARPAHPSPIPTRHRERFALAEPCRRHFVPVCPHAGGAGRREPVGHLPMFDYTSVSASLEDRVIAHVDHLHEHFTEPTVIENGRYRAPRAPGFSAETKRESLRHHTNPTGPEWSKNR